MIRVFGITGTNGKTTAAYMLRNILEQRGPCGLIGTIEYIINNRRYEPPNTTPGRELLEKLFMEMREGNINQCVMEVSSHGIHQGRISNVSFSAAGFTNLSRDHLDYHGTMEEYYQVKKSLFERQNMRGAVNLDDGYGRRLYRELTADKPAAAEKNIKGYSLEVPDADFYGKITESTISGTNMEVYICGRYAGELKVPIAGRHFAEDALLAAAMAQQEGIPFEQIRIGIDSIPGVAGRMELVGDTEDTLGIVDYAHTPDSLRRLLETVNELKKGRLLCVFGCGGFRDKGKRFQMGEIAGLCSDYCIITNDNPRGEPPENIAEAIEEGLRPTGCDYSIILDRYQAIKRAVSLAGKWDIIVVAGKGHEAYQLSGGERVPFDDRKVLKELLEKKYERTYNEADRNGNRRTPDFRK